MKAAKVILRSFPLGWLGRGFTKNKNAMRKIKNPFEHREGYCCFGCSPANPIGIRMEFYEDGDDIVSFWNPKTYYQGWFDTMHGGILATIADETAAWTMFRKLQTTGMTVSLDLRYKKAVMTTEGQITVRGRIAGQRRNLVTIGVTIENSRGEVCVEATAVYFAFGKDKAAEMGFTSCELEGDELLPM